MMIHEFTERTGYEPSFEEYHFIEESYYEFDGYKDDFCKWFKKAQKSGEWEKELKLRKQIEEMKKAHEEELKELKEEKEFYEKEYHNLTNLKRILEVTGRESSNIRIRLKNEVTSRRYTNVKVKYIDNGARRFINIIEESGWTTSVNLDSIEYIHC